MNTQAETAYQNQEQSLNNLNLYRLEYDVYMEDSHYQHYILMIEALNWNWAINHLDSDCVIENLKMNLVQKDYKMGVDYGSRSLKNFCSYHPSYPNEIMINFGIYDIEITPIYSRMNASHIHKNIYAVVFEGKTYKEDSIKKLIRSIESGME